MLFVPDFPFDESRAPYGARGLKCCKQTCPAFRKMSRPVWGAWIEMHNALVIFLGHRGSRPVWGAWIEMYLDQIVQHLANVAPRMGRVD